jgi:hypothetical protein
LAAESLLVLAVQASLPVTTVQELIDYAKQNPGKLSYGSAGVGSAHHIAGELMKQKTGIDMAHVAYRGGSGDSGPRRRQYPDQLRHHPVRAAACPAGTIRIIALAEAKPGSAHAHHRRDASGVVTNTWVGFLRRRERPLRSSTSSTRR